MGCPCGSRSAVGVRLCGAITLPEARTRGMRMHSYERVCVLTARGILFDPSAVLPLSTPTKNQGYRQMDGVQNPDAY